MTDNNWTSAGLMTQTAEDAVTTMESQKFQVKTVLNITHNMILLTLKLLKETYTYQYNGICHTNM